MKKIFVSSFLVLAMALTGCQDAIDIIQKGELSEEKAFQTINDLTNGLNVVYGQLDNYTQIELNSVWTDEVGIGYDNGGQGLDGDYTFSMTSGNGFAAGIYQSAMYTINRANRIIRASQNFTNLSAADQEIVDDIVAQCKFIRAYAHFQLLTYYTVDLKDSNALGCPIVDFVPDITDKINRSTIGEVLTFIQEDLDFANDNLINTSSNIFASPNAVKALKSRIALFTGDYPTAITLSNELIAEYPLANRMMYKNIWLDLANNGVIFKMERAINGATIGQIWQSKDHTITGSSFYEVGRSLFNKLSDQDIRKEVIVNLTPGTGSVIDPDYANSSNYKQSDKLLINKYPGSHGQFRLNDLKIFRVEEQYFIKAEALARTNDLAGAAAAVQAIVDVRYNAGAAPVQSYSSLSQALAAILDERRIELAFEGHRFVDLKRLGVEAGRGIDRDPKDMELIGTTVSPPATDSYKFTLPIPAREITINPELVQNPGY
nr:RagB/SusD family nutrient uptake outer membrane protein [uncultured Flavobacterium sp.]